MFEIEYKGGNCVVLSTKKTTIIVDPKLSLVGLKDMKIKDEIQLVTESRFIVDNPDARVTIQSPGEYEVGEFSIKAASATRHLDTETDEKNSTLYHIDTSEVRVGLIGNVKDGLDDDQLETIGVVDVLIIPVGGGGYTLGATGAAAMVRQIEPKIIIPVHYADPGLHYEVPQDSLETFIKELGAPLGQMDKLKLKDAGALPQSLTIIALKRN